MIIWPKIGTYGQFKTNYVTKVFLALDALLIEGLQCKNVVKPHNALPCEDIDGEPERSLSSELSSSSS